MTNWLQFPTHTYVTLYPVKSRAVRMELAKEEVCPDCGVKLDKYLDCPAEGCDFRGIDELKKSPAFKGMQGDFDA